MKINIVSPGKIKDKWLKDGIAEYQKRISRFCTLEFIEVSDVPDSVPVDEALRREGEAILARVKPGDVLWAMDLGGENVTSEKLSEYLMADIEKGGGTLVIAIGGSNGISPEVRSGFGSETEAFKEDRIDFFLAVLLARGDYGDNRKCRNQESGSFHNGLI